MKKIITLLSFMLCFFATAQEKTDTMYIYQNDNVVKRIPVSQIDSVIFVIPKAPAVPDVPETSVYEAIDLGLPSGVKWATCNVGASNPEEYGGYYAWGEIEEKDSYTEDNSFTYGKYYGGISGNPEYDVACAKWGGAWRMPTAAEQQELLENCTWRWTAQNGINGYKVIAPNGNSIFLPASGCRNGTKIDGEGELGYYWSGSVNEGNNYGAYYLDFNSGSNGLYSFFRNYGFSVRPVCDGTTVPVENYTVSVLSNGNGVVSIEGTQESSVTVSAGASVTVVATPDSGYKFIGWYIGESETPVSTDATYTFIVSANVALVAKFEAEESGDSGSLNGHDYVDLGLSVKWATCNVGASSPEDYGDYYAWGEIKEKDDYTKDNSVTYGKDMSSISGNPEYDVASAQWGDTWRMPTSDEINELCKNCTWEWTTRNNVNGYKVTGPNGNSIFLPAAGNCNGTKVNNIGSYGCYWSGSMYKDFLNAYDLLFNSSRCDLNTSYRYQGLSVRPVYGGTTVPVENYTVSVSSEANGTVLIEGTDEKSITVSADETVTVTATPADGYKFVGWYVEGTDTPVSTDAAYTFTVSENIALVAKFEAEESGVSGNLDGHDYVDLGLPSGLKWATCNVGATSPEESGVYRIWSATTYDWGNNWRMPTKDDFQELINNCTWSWITQNGVNGIEFTSSNGNRIFLPAAGYGSGSTLYEFGSAGFYWSSTSYDIYNSFPLLFNHNGCSVTDYMSREYSLSIRLVFSEN